MYISAPNSIDYIIIREEACSGFKLEEEIVNSVVRLGGALTVKSTNDELLAYILFAVEIDKCTYKPTAHPIALAFSDMYAIKLLVRHLRVTFDKVVYSAYCIDRLGLECETEWNYISVNSERYKVTVDYNKCFSSSFGKLIPSLSKFSNEFKKLKGDRNIYLPTKCKDAATTVVNQVDKLGSDVYKVNMFSPDYCKYLVDKIKVAQFETNSDEDELYQIPEVVLKFHDSELYLEIEELFYSYIRKYMEVLRFKKEFNINSIQFAKYSATSKINKGNWHYDEDSDSTLVVYLNDDYEGGGTEFKPSDLGDVITVDKFDTGDSIFFNGKVTPHRGLPVTKGDRYILVFWCTGLYEVFE